MLKGSFLPCVIIYGLLITSVSGAETDSCDWMAIAAGVVVSAGAVIAAPAVLAGVGFGSAGVVAGSIAAAIQTPATVSGSFFALAQSAGAAGLGLGTQATIGGVAGFFGYKGFKTANGCEEPKCG